MVESLDDSIIVVGIGPEGSRVAQAINSRDGTPDSSADAIILAGNLSTQIDISSLTETLPPDVFTIGIITLPRRPTPEERSKLTLIQSITSATIISSTLNGPSTENALRTSVESILELLNEPGFINLDLADAQTVLNSDGLAVFGRATGSLDQPRSAENTVHAAINSIVSGFDISEGSGILLHLIGGSDITIEHVREAVTTINTRLSSSAHSIWGGAIDDSRLNEVDIRLIIAGVNEQRVQPGDSCPRCKHRLSAYILNANTTVACDSCGYSNVSVDL